MIHLGGARVTAPCMAKCIEHIMNSASENMYINSRQNYGHVKELSCYIRPMKNTTGHLGLQSITLFSHLQSI